LDMSCPIGTVNAGHKFGSFRQSQAQTKVVYSHNTKENTPGPFHVLHMGIRDVTVS
jgi:hypothetical protein